MACLRKRNGTYYAQYYVGPKQKRISLRTTSYQIAKAKLDELQVKLNQGNDSPLPTQTPLTQAVQKYLDYGAVARMRG